MIEFSPEVKEVMWWLEEEDTIAQQDCAAPHSDKRMPNTFNKARIAGGWRLKLVTQPAQSPDLSIHQRLGIFCVSKE